MKCVFCNKTNNMFNKGICKDCVIIYMKGIIAEQKDGEGKNEGRNYEFKRSC